MNQAPSTPPIAATGYNPALIGFARGRREFFWIAGLSLINSLLAQFGANVRFPVGLGLSQVTDAVLIHGFGEGNGVAKAAALVLALFFSGLVLLFGWLTGRGNKVLFILGIVLYILDGLLCLAFQDWFSVGFHAWISFRLFQAWGLTRN